ncbi:MAG: ATP-binding protein [Gammaproteobacteria bacterium]|nr:MAG: ATP-binding protein [Gammaproteobacteria bacterium]
MISTLSIANYRSLLNLIIQLGNLNVITGANASGKSNLYKALRLLAETAQGGVIRALAKEGGLESTFWAGPEKISEKMKTGETPIEGGLRKKASRLRLGFSGNEFSYSISLGLPTPSSSAFSLDPEIKQECIWYGDTYRHSSLLINREGGVIKARSDRNWNILTKNTNNFESIFSIISDPVLTPEVVVLREEIRNWRFYDHFRTDSEAPARLPQLGTRTPALHHDGRDLAAAIQTIIEIGDQSALNLAISDAFPGAKLTIENTDGHFTIRFHQEGLLRSLTGLELSDGTLRYLLWVAALLTPRPPPLMILNEPETSLHPDLIPALARLITKAADTTQVWIVSHSKELIDSLEQNNSCNSIKLTKEFGQTKIIGQNLLNTPSWHWPDKNK